MSTFNKRIVLGLILILIFIPSSYLNTSESRDQALRTSKTSSRLFIDSNGDKENVKISKVWGKIHIDDTNPSMNWSVAENDGICTGNGTYSDPYVIEDLVIDGGGSGNCILINNSKVYFRIENCTVYNSGGYPSAGIRLENVNNSLLINNTCSANSHGIRLGDSNNSTISGNIANNNNLDGIVLSTSDNNTVSENTVRYNNRRGTALYSGDYNNISRNTANNNKDNGIHLYYSNNNHISENTANDNNDNGIFLYYSESNNVSRNLANNNNYYGIHLYYGGNNIIFGNIINDNHNHGIHFYYGGYNVVEGNSLNNNQFYAMYLYNCEGYIISGNNMTGSYFKIYGSVSELSSHTITSNLVEDKFLYYYNNEVNLQPQDFTNAGDIMLVNCRYSHISNINISNLGHIYLFFSDHNFISGNIVSNQLDYGIEIRYSSYNTISENTISNNQGTGVYLYESNRNQISGNTVINNSGGIYISLGYENEIHGNTVDDNDYYGINVQGNPASTTITNNFVSNNYYGIYVYDLDSCTISENNINNNDYGICLHYSDYNVIRSNIITNNDIGIWLVESYHNEISNNSFTGNNEDIVGEPPTPFEFNPFVLILVVISILAVVTIISIGYILRKKHGRKEIELSKELVEKEVPPLKPIPLMPVVKIDQESLIEEPPKSLKSEVTVLEEKLPEISEGLKLPETQPIEQKISEIEEISSEVLSPIVEIDEKEKIEEKTHHFCSNCGKPLVDTWKICTYCGMRIRKELWEVTRKPKIEKVKIEKPSSLKSEIDLQADKVEHPDEIIEEVKPIPSIGIKEVEITSEDFKEEPATETPKEVLDKSGISPGTDKVEEIEIQEKIMEEIKEELQPEVQMVEEVEITEVMEISDRFNMSQSNIKLKLNGNAEAVFAFPNKKNEFYIDLFNMSSNYLSQAKIKIEGPPEVKLLVKFEWYGKVAPGKSKRRLFIIIPKEEGTFQLTAYLTSNKKPIIDTSFEVRVGKVGMTQEVSKPSMAPTEAETIKKTNCPFCDELINSDVSFCPHCGSNIKRKLEKSQKDVKDPKFCVKCGAELPSQAKFCIKCGSKLEY